MASKGQKFKKYTLAQKEEVLAKYIEGYSAKYLGQGQKRGRPKKDLKKEDYKERYEILKKYQAFLKAQRERK